MPLGVEALGGVKSKGVRKAARKDKSQSYWIEYGDNLLKKIAGRRKIHKSISYALAELRTAVEQNQDSSGILKKLNGYKGDLGDDWGKWLARVRQIPKDKNRSKLYVSTQAYDKVSSFNHRSGQKQTLSRSTEQLFDMLEKVGLHSIGDLMTFEELMTDYSSLAYDELKKKSFSEQSRNPDDTSFQTFVLLIDKLKELGVKDAASLSNLVTMTKDANKLERHINRSETLRDKVKSLEEQVADLKGQLRARRNRI